MLHFLCTYQNWDGTNSDISKDGEKKMNLCNLQQIPTWQIHLIQQTPHNSDTLGTKKEQAVIMNEFVPEL